MTRAALVALVALGPLSGCLAVPRPLAATASPGGGLAPDAGRQTCAALAESARGARDASIGLGAAALALGAGGAITAAAMGPDRAVDAWWIARNRNVVTLTSAVLVSAAGVALLVRGADLAGVASEAQELTAAASLAGGSVAGGSAGARGIDDADAYRGCLELGGGSRRSGARDVAELRTELRAQVRRVEAAPAAAEVQSAADARRLEAEFAAKQTVVSLLEERLGRLALERELVRRELEAAAKVEPPPPPKKPGKPAPPLPQAPDVAAQKTKELARVVAELELTTRQLESARAEAEAARRAIGGARPGRFDIPTSPARRPDRRIPDDLGY